MSVVCIVRSAIDSLHRYNECNTYTIANPSLSLNLSYTYMHTGPNLVSYKVEADGSYSPFVDIPSDDDNINIHEHAGKRVQDM